MHRRVRVGQASIVGGQQVAALGFRYRRDEALPLLREKLAHAVQEPVDLAALAQEDAAQDQAADAFRMRLGVSQRQRAAPGASEHQPALDAQLLAQPFYVHHQVGGAVVAQLAARRGAAAAALVEQDRAVEGGSNN